MSSSTRQLHRRDFLLCTGGAGVLLASGGLDMILNRQLHNPLAIAAAAPRLTRIPTTIGAWNSTELKVDDREIRHGRITGSLRRVYRHSENGKTATLTLLCGAAGPISVHPPTACFEGVGYSLVSGPTLTELKDVEGVPVSLNRASFRPQEAGVAEIIRVFWGWSTNGNWDAPSNPRVAFHGEPVLFKLYVVDQGYETADDLAQSEAFLRDALPAIRTALAADAVTAPQKG
ncbi:MAG: exosortase-associated EpsI family protein [Planctomycetota bacterium]